MAFEGQQNRIPGLICGATSLATKQYYYVKLSGDLSLVICNGATDIPIGILQNKPGIGEEAIVAGPGSVSKVSSDEALTAGWMVGPSADGQADRKIPGTDTTEYMCGQVLLGTSAAGELATVTVEGPRKAT